MCEIKPRPVFQEEAPLALLLLSRLREIHLKISPSLVRTVALLLWEGVMCDTEPTGAELQEKLRFIVGREGFILECVWFCFFMMYREALKCAGIRNSFQLWASSVT